MMDRERSATLVLRPTARAVFSKTSATLGEQQSHGAPTGASLLGWAAQNYSAFGDDAYDVFHSGKVRFSNAFPVDAESGECAYPTPTILLYPKHGGDPFFQGDLLDKRIVFVGSEAFAGRHNDQQAKPLRGDYLTGCGKRVRPDMGGRLRTATEDGRAKNAALFGYRHIEPSETLEYKAVIEASCIKDDVWEKVLARFDNQTLYIGRSSRNSYGGGYACEVETCNVASSNGRGGEAATHTPKRAYVWALSDLALVGAYGAPTPLPNADELDMRGARLVHSECSIATHRYAPWNSKFKKRDTERQVVSAGSVFVLECELTTPQDYRTSIGLFREFGLGQVWINPPLLLDLPGVLDASYAAAAKNSHTGKTTSKADISNPNDTPTTELQKWATRSAHVDNTVWRDKTLESLKKRLEDVRKSAHSEGPSTSQWAILRSVAKEALDWNDLQDKIKQKASGIDLSSSPWTFDAPKSYGEVMAEWFADKTLSDQPYSHIIWILESIADFAGGWDK